jgi:glycosyltransferase involved in cell wall biosynthesis
MLSEKIPRVSYLKVIDEIELTHSLCRLYVHEKPWILVFDTPILLTYHKKILTKDITIFKLARSLTKKLVIAHNCKRIIPFSQAAKGEFLRMFDVPKDLLEVLPPGVEVPVEAKACKKQGCDKITILFVGRNFARKGGFELLNAFYNLCLKYENLHLIVKTGTRFPPPEHWNIYKNIKEKITWICHQINRNELNELYRQADIFALPTRFEPFGLAVLEAMSYALPVVTSNIYALPEIVEHGKTGFLIPPGNSEELFKKLHLLIESKSLRERMGREGRNRVESRFSNEVINRRLKEIYEQCLKK